MLRIEDTDETREHPEAIEQIQRSLRWVGVEWDEGPASAATTGRTCRASAGRATTRSPRSSSREGRAYRCYCTTEELAAEREAAQREGRPFIYSRRCLALSDEERAAREAAGDPSVIRLRVPDTGECVVDDLVRGAVRFEYAQLGDHVIVRSDGVPTYNFANPIDDADMQITHVIRGEDLLSSTPRQVLVHEALGSPVPSFAHLPLLFGPDRKRLSKRHGATSVEELRENGYLAEAVVNFLSLLGWHFDSERELFTLSELIGLFSLERVNPAPAVFDAKKLEWMNGVYLRALPTFDLAERLTAFLRERGSPLASQPDRIVEVTPLAQEKIATLAEFEPLCAFLFGPIEIDREAWDKVAGHERAAEILDGSADGAHEDRLGRRRDRRGPAPRLRGAVAQAPRRVRSRARGRDRHEHLARPLREHPRARARRDAQAPRRGRSAPLSTATAARRRAGPRPPRTRGPRPRTRVRHAKRALRAPRRPRAPAPGFGPAIPAAPRACRAPAVRPGRRPDCPARACARCRRA